MACKQELFFKSDWNSFAASSRKGADTTDFDPSRASTYALVVVSLSLGNEEKKRKEKKTW